MRASIMMVASVLLLGVLCVVGLGSLAGEDCVGMRQLSTISGADNNCAIVNTDQIQGCVNIPAHPCPGMFPVYDTCNQALIYHETACSTTQKNLCKRGTGCCIHVALDCGTHEPHTACDAVPCSGGYHCVTPWQVTPESCYEGEVKAQGC